MLLSVTQQHTNVRLKGCVHKIKQMSIQALNILALQKFMNRGNLKKIQFKTLQCYIDRSVIYMNFRANGIFIKEINLQNIFEKS
jgi:hypothetical protein